ncbi:MAG: TonB-dependent receptor [Gemmatimonadota bacterium]
MRVKRSAHSPARLIQRTIAFFGFAILVPTGAAKAQEERVLPMRELVVSASRTETELRDVPVNVTVLTREDLALSSAQSLQDILLEIPGLGFQRNVASGSAHPSFQAISLRGLGGTAASRTLVLVDGVPLNDGYFGWVRWSQIPVEIIERVEIVRGGGSTTWGGQSLAGVINVITRDPDEAGFSLGAQAGSLSTVRGDAMGMFGGGNVSGFLAGEFFDTDGYILTTPEQRGTVDVPSSSDHLALRGKVTIDASETLQIFATAGYFDQDKINATLLRPNSTKSGFGQVGLRLGRSTGSQLSLDVFGQGQTYTNAISSVDATRDSEVPALDQFDIPSQTFGAKLQWSDNDLGRHTPSAGVDLQAINGEAFEQFLLVNGAFTRKRHTGGDQFLTGIYLQDRFQANERLQLNGGVRLDVWNNTNGFRQIDNLSTGEGLTDTEFEDRSEVRFNGNLGVRVIASDRTSIRGSVYTGLRVPTLNELYKPFRSSGGIVTESNPDLVPERLTGFEAGIDYQLGRRWLARATGFWNEVSDAILDATIQEVESGMVVDPCGFVPAGGTCRQRQNVGKIRAIGLETQIEFRPAGAWLVAASFDITPSEITEAAGRPEIVGNRPPRSAKSQATLRVGHLDASILEVVVSGRYVGSRFENDLNTSETEDAFLVDIRLAREINSTLSAFATVQNIFDAEWQISNEPSLTRLGTPRSFIGGLRIRVNGAAR